MTAIRELLAAAVHARLTTALTGATVERSRRTDPEVGETLPIVIVRMRGDLQPVPDLSATDEVWQVEFGVEGFAGGANDTAAEQALADLEARTIEALLNQPLERPGGGDLTTGIVLSASSAELFDATENARSEGAFSALFRAELFLAPGRTSL